jgi:hypothetical protein
MKPVSSVCRIEISPDVLQQKVDSEVVLLDLRSECYFGLNEVGARIWELLVAEVSMGEIPDVITKEFQVEPRQVRDDLALLVGELLEAGLIRLV